MLSYELAINEDGEPFAVPPQVKGWRARRIPSRGRPKLIHDRGKPLIIPVDATHTDLLSAAGPGRYRLEAVDEHRRKVEGIPAACTGPLSDDEIDDETSDDDEGETMASGAGGRRMRMEDVICQLLANQTRMVEATLGQMGTVISGVAGLLQAAHQTGVLAHVPAQVVAPPPPAPVPPLAPDDHGDDDPDEDDDEAVEVPPPSMLPEALRLIIERAVDKLVPLIFEKITSGDGIGGLPLAAFLDWRKAAPTAATHATAAPAEHSPTPSAPIPASAPAPAAPPPTATTAASPPPATAGTTGAAATTSYAAPVATASPPPTAAPAGAAPLPSRNVGAAPAGMTTAAATSAPIAQELTHEEASAMLNAHILQIWQGLSTAERGRASELIACLTDEQRTAWFAELARLSVPEAITRARAVLQAQSPPTPPTASLLSASPKGDPT